MKTHHHGRQIFGTLLLLVIYICIMNAPAIAESKHSHPEHSSTLQTVLKKGQLHIGVSLFTPWTLKNSQGELVGFEIDIAKKLANDMGVEPKFHELAWHDILPALLNKDIDIIIAGMVITPQRALKVNFSHPYVESGIGLATNHQRTKSFTSLKDLNQPASTIAVVTDTVSEGLARRVFPNATIQTFLTSQKAIRAITTGKVHGYIELNPLPTFLALDHPDKVDTPLSKPLLSTKAGFAVNKGDADFINFLNSWIIAREADTWLTSAHKYWFRSLDWRKDAGVKE
ncbi:transporter substrate-binding domain-containing protein [Candidatus Nitrospira salsa]